MTRLAGNLIKVAIAALIFYLALTLGAHNANAATTDLAADVSQLAGRPVEITIAPDLPGSWGGSAAVGAPHIYIGRDAYNDAQRGGSHGLFVLLHELGHTTGIYNEAAANCYSLAHLAGFLRANWDLPVLDDGWSARFDSAVVAYQQAVGFMHGQTAIYQCAGA